jgi:5-methylcytosine-specific restriction endonuclease McrA
MLRFFTGKPCVNNHLSQRTTANGGCLRCNTELANQLYHLHNPEQRSAYRAGNRAWKRANPEKIKVDHHRRRARKRAAEGHHTADELKALFQRQRGRCAYCGTSIRTGYHVDHIVALARGGSNWITNISLACAKCNTSKGAIDPIEFARRLGRLV